MQSGRAGTPGRAVPPVRRNANSSRRESTPTILCLAEWMRRKGDHQGRVQPWTMAYRDRAARGGLHPVYDFLWRYYSFRPSQLERWHPGIGVVLEGAEARRFLSFPGYIERDGGVAVEPTALPAARRDSIA